ncbi:hypothetical protein [Enterococcus faecalis]|uniref:hypothetical protein n=1 Tax=Enterococcus faecalis TaxID=1351 RepID=UPI001A081A39|nr:hypothetical protein [Enterococcus faecalis]EGO2718690.1 hypothetical protein [Enterococcus faecalis]EME3232520.1 hypothetical protein [Enterococcus faecalis]MDN3171672.1 hypothetical protein [Enterococcus faecalis]MDU1451666.1 hypothetical protein [Enterococcus faecalis]HBG9547765.1 hypothetical protein [Enterococcus faecalis]
MNKILESLYNDNYKFVEKVLEPSPIARKYLDYQNSHLFYVPVLKKIPTKYSEEDINSYMCNLYSSNLLLRCKYINNKFFMYKVKNVEFIEISVPSNETQTSFFSRIINSIDFKDMMEKGFLHFFIIVHGNDGKYLFGMLHHAIYDGDYQFFSEKNEEIANTDIKGYLDISKKYFVDYYTCKPSQVNFEDYEKNKFILINKYKDNENGFIQIKKYYSFDFKNIAMSLELFWTIKIYKVLSEFFSEDLIEEIPISLIAGRSAIESKRYKGIVDFHDEYIYSFKRGLDKAAISDIYEHEKEIPYLNSLRYNNNKDSKTRKQELEPIILLIIFNNEENDNHQELKKAILPNKKNYVLTFKIGISRDLKTIDITYRYSCKLMNKIDFLFELMTSKYIVEKE